MSRFSQAHSLAVQMFAFQGATGVWDLVAMWPTVPLAAFAEKDAVYQAPALSAIPIIISACFTLVVCNLSVSVGIACSSAFFMSIGGLLAIPVAFVTDYFLHGDVPDVLSIVGASLVIGAFLVLTICTPKSNGDTSESSDLLNCEPDNSRAVDRVTPIS